MTVSMDTGLLVSRIERELPRFSYRFSDEKQLHDGIAEVLTTLNLPFEREKVITAKDRFDFFVAESVVLEVKVQGSFGDALRQADRYAALPKVHAVILVASTVWARKHIKDKATLRGKPVRFVTVGRQAF